MKKILCLLVIFCLAISAAPLSALAEDENNSAGNQEQNQEQNEEQNEADIEDPIQVDPSEIMYHFSLKVQWGNVLGEIQNSEQADFDGSISLSSDAGRVSYVNDFLFEENDLITNKTPQVTWTSKITNHWDGVKVLVSGKGGDTLTIATAQGNLVKTVKDFYGTRTPIIQDVGSGREIIVKVFPIKKRVFNLEVLWGGGPENLKVDFSGNLSADRGAVLKHREAIRFEKEQGDKVVLANRQRIYWNSYTFGGNDGIIAKVALKKNMRRGDTFILNFTADQVKWSKSYDIIDFFHNKLVEETLTIGGQEYNVTLAVERFTNRKLVKTAKSSSVYMIEDEEAQSILSEEVFEENNLDWGDVETISEDELAAYASGEEVNYPDGTLVKGSGGTVYVIADGRRRGFKTRKAFDQLGYKLKNVIKIRDVELNKYPEEAAVTEASEPPEGALVREKGTAGVYVIKGGKRVPVNSREIFESNGYKWGRVLDVEKKILEKRPKASETLNHPDGTLIQEQGKQDVYIIDKGEKRPINSTEDLKSLNLRLEKVKKVKAEEISRLKTGKDLVGK